MADDDEVLRRRYRELRTRYGKGGLDAKMEADPSILYEPTPDELAAKAAATRNPNWQAPAVKGPTLWERVKTFDPEAFLRGGAQVASRGAIDELVGGNAANPTINPMLPPIYPEAVKRAAIPPAEKLKTMREATKEYRAADDEKFTNSPTSYLLGGVAGMGLGGNPAGGFAAGLPRVGALGAEGLLGGLMSSRGDLGTSEGRREALLDAGKGTAFGLGVGGAGEAVARTLRPRNLPGVAEPQPSTAERAYQHQVTRDITKDANPTYSKRAVGDPGAREMVVDLIEREPTINKLRTGPREELAQAADNVASRLDPERLPIYSRFDTEGPGRIGYKELDDYLSSQVQQSTLDLGQKKELQRGLEHVRERLAERYALQKKMAPNELEPTLSHAEAREWVTGLLKQKQMSVGSVNEMAAYNWRDELHRAGDDFLKERMDLGAQVYPHLQPDLERLRPLNKDIAAALKIQDVAFNAENRGNFARKPFAERVGIAADKTVRRAAIPAVAGSGWHGPIGAAVGGGAAAVIPPLAVGLTRAGVEVLGKLSRAARRGSNTAQLVIEATSAGVPDKMIQMAIGAADRIEGAEKRKPPPKNPNEAVRQRREVKP